VSGAFERVEVEDGRGERRREGGGAGASCARARYPGDDETTTTIPSSRLNGEACNNLTTLSFS